MGFDGQPYIYDRPTTYAYSDFNPRAATEALQKAEEDRKKTKKQDGPLINFNAHPDSYMIVPGKNVADKTMSPHTKKTVTVLRWTQFALRIFQDFGAVGLLVCVVCLGNMETSTSWIVRLAPAWDIIVSFYATYHLCRQPTRRTPGSAASYHLFALFMDVGLTPFYVFIAIFARNNYVMDPDAKHRWDSFFKQKGATTILLEATWIAAAAMAGLHLISTILDLWLVIVFRKISKLPPDMNPLEDHLTGRSSRASKHKYKNSEVTLVDSFTEKKPGYLSGSTVSVNDLSRLSTATKDGEDARRVPFHHSRTGSEATFSPHNPDSVRWSQQHYGEVAMYQQPQAARSSQIYNQTRASRPASPSKHGSFTEYIDLNNSRPSSAARSRDQFSPARYSSPALPNAAPSNALVRSQQTEPFMNKNWFATEDEVSDSGSPSRHRMPAPVIHVEERKSFDVQPLRMNPPTPPPKQIPYNDNAVNSPKRSALTERRDNGNGNSGLGRHLTVISNGTEGSSVYSESAPPLKPNKPTSSPKAKYYGDLQTAARGVRGANSQERVLSHETVKSNGTVNAAAYDATGMMALGDYGYAPDPPPKSSKRFSKTGGMDRVVSTGVDVVDAQALYPADNGGFGLRDRRDVSGKVAEEGRGGRSWMWGRH